MARKPRAPRTRFRVAGTNRTLRKRAVKKVEAGDYTVRDPQTGREFPMAPRPIKDCGVPGPAQQVVFGKLLEGHDEETAAALAGVSWKDWQTAKRTSAALAARTRAMKAKESRQLMDALWAVATGKATERVVERIYKHALEDRPKDAPPRLVALEARQLVEEREKETTKAPRLEAIKFLGKVLGSEAIIDADRANVAALANIHVNAAASGPKFIFKNCSFGKEDAEELAALEELDRRALSAAGEEATAEERLAAALAVRMGGGKRVVDAEAEPA